LSVVAVVGVDAAEAEHFADFYLEFALFFSQKVVTLD